MSAYLSIECFPMDESEKRIESGLNRVIGIMAHEGVELTDEQIESCRAILSGEADADELVEQIFEKYRRKDDVLSGKG